MNKLFYFILLISTVCSCVSTSGKKSCANKLSATLDLSKSTLDDCVTVQCRKGYIEEFVLPSYEDCLHTCVVLRDDRDANGFDVFQKCIRPAPPPKPAAAAKRVIVKAATPPAAARATPPAAGAAPAK